MEALNILWRNQKWRLQNPATLIMTSIQPLFWLLLFSTMFGSKAVAGGGQNYTAFSLPGILVMLVLTSAGISGIANYSMKTGGIYYRVYISPVKRSSIVLGHILDVAVAAFVSIAILSALSLLLGATVASGIAGVLLIILLLVLTIAFVAGLSYAISFLFRDENPFIALVNTFVMPLFFVSTALMPYDQVPGGFKIAVLINPFTHVINSLRNLMLNATPDWGLYLLAAGLMAALTVLSFLLAVRCLQKDEK
ncbi:ABC transporter permease [Acetanaerobacterium elongatum]|uniref:Transport permease protein n=1 Tax=Acetanaerobacterium elongatum TaxID=258515 RepID=A0A1H0CXQ1_9FIRM|nr:ABC transporter permease [Acetanaerobacterium elongatum]SDN62401.1 ABC-2 type transport system permease protein [Acetanaerobacterium elongatum]